MLQCLGIMLQAHQMMKTEVCSAGEPHMAPARFWACQTSQLPYSQWQQTPSLFFSPPNIYLPFYPPSKLQAVFQKQNPQTEAASHGYTTETTVGFSLDFVSYGLCSRLTYGHERPLPFPFNEMTKQQICICRSRCCNRFDYSRPKACKKDLSATAVPKVLGLWRTVKTLPSARPCVKNDNLN